MIKALLIKLIRNVYLFFLKFLRKTCMKKNFILKGKCVKCGACCEFPSIQVGTIIWHFKFIQKLFLLWQNYMYGFELVKKDPQYKEFVFKCKHFDKKTRMCKNYKLRPGMCIDYPEVLLYQLYPRFFNTCGYRPYNKDAQKMLKLYEKHGLTKKQIEFLKKHLYLE